MMLKNSTEHAEPLFISLLVSIVMIEHVALDYSPSQRFPISLKGRNGTGEKSRKGTSARCHTLVFLKPGVPQFKSLPKRGSKSCVANFCSHKFSKWSQTQKQCKVSDLP